jgi:hypothetical protein
MQHVLACIAARHAGHAGCPLRWVSHKLGVCSACRACGSIQRIPTMAFRLGSACVAVAASRSIQSFPTLRTCRPRTSQVTSTLHAAQRCFTLLCSAQDAPRAGSLQGSICRWQAQLRAVRCDSGLRRGSVCMHALTVRLRLLRYGRVQHVSGFHSRPHHACSPHGRPHHEYLLTRATERGSP